MNKKLKNLKTFEDYFYMDKEEIKEPQIDKEWGDEEEVPSGADHDDWDDEEEVKEVDQEVVGNEDEDCEDCDDEVEEFVDREFENVLSFEKFSNTNVNEGIFSVSLKELQDSTKLDKYADKIKSKIKDYVDNTTNGGAARAAKHLPNLYAYFKGSKSLNDIKDLAKNNSEQFQKEVAMAYFQTYVVSKNDKGEWVNKAPYGGAEGLAGGTNVGGGNPTDKK